jgi:hypothetical protein
MNLPFANVAPNSGIYVNGAPLPELPPAIDTNSQSMNKVGPISLTPPMPSITAPRSTQVTPQSFQSLACWVGQHPLLAVLGAGALFLMAKGGTRGQ